MNGLRLPGSPDSRWNAKSIGATLLALMVLVTIFSLYNTPLEHVPTVPLSQVATAIKEGNVKKITIQEDRILLERTDGKKERATREQDASLSETLRNFGVAEEQLRAVEVAVERPSGLAFWLATLLPAILPFILLGGFMLFMIRSAQAANNRAISFGQVRSRPTGELPPKKRVTFKDVAGAREAKEELLEIVDFLKHPKKFTAIGARIPKGVLLVGPPGTGKTLLAKAVAGEANVPFFHMSGSEFVEMFVGVGASRVRDLFKKAKQHAPAIVFVDELDAVGRQRGAGLGGGHDEREQTLNQILVEMDGFETDAGVIVVAATNRPDVLDPALLRPGRFDRHVTLDIPDIGERDEILKVHVQGKPLAKNVVLRVVAERTPGFSGADLSNLVNEAAILTVRRGRKLIGLAELLDSIEKVLLGPERKGHVFSPHEKEIAAFHEAGHAVVAHILPHVDPVRKISIVARGRAGGYTLKLPESDKHLHSRAEFFGELSTLLGGYVAEHVKFQDLTTGASNDLKRATQLARSIVTQYGMSTLGPMTFGEREEFVFLGRDLGEQRNYSEETASRIDKEVRRLLEEAQRRAEDVIQSQREKWERVAHVLIEKETIEQEEFRKLMSDTPPHEPTATAETTPETVIAEPPTPKPTPAVAPAGA